ncbi:Pyrroline-5-carboxylate reductase 3 [Varanus komodoensis]|nr:Pyrroline-5-carboxylate reductase 3 [Varanus komodoensis]
MEKLRELRVGFIGAGRMAGAVAQAMLMAGKARTSFLHYPEAPFQPDSPGSDHSRRCQKPAEQSEIHSLHPASGIDPPPGQSRLFQSQNQVGSWAKMDQDNATRLGNGLPPPARPPCPKKEPGRPDGEVQAANIFASAPSNRNLAKFQDFDCKTTHCNLEVVENCTVVFLATKPHILPAVLREVAPAVTSDHMVISMAAGVTLQTLEEMLPAGTKVLRIMPNLPCVVQSGAVVLSRGTSAGEDEVTLLKQLLSPCGLCEETPEAYIDVHTGLSGSGVAYGHHGLGTPGQQEPRYLASKNASNLQVAAVA